jgi:hypothetical protein
MVACITRIQLQLLNCLSLLLNWTLSFHSVLLLFRSDSDLWAPGSGPKYPHMDHKEITDCHCWSWPLTRHCGNTNPQRASIWGFGNLPWIHACLVTSKHVTMLKTHCFYPASKLYWMIVRRWSAKLVPTFADKEVSCVSAVSTHSR